jgi:hypothetical protein
MVGIAAVLVLFAIVTVVVQFKEPAEKAVVKVTHLFEADPGQELEQAKALPKDVRSELHKSPDPKPDESPEEDPQPVPELVQGTSFMQAETQTSNEAEKIKAAQETELKAIEAELLKAEKKLKNVEMKELKPAEPKEIKENAEALLKISEEVKHDTIDFNETADDVKEKSLSFSENASALLKVSRLAASGKKLDSVKIASNDYTKIYRERFSSGSKNPANLYRWRVSTQYGASMRDCYMLFDMKAVAVTKDGKYYDLNDFTQLSEDYLNNSYSSTIIVCENPERDFGDKIRSFGLSGKGVSVRYYMYDHIRNYFYNRVEHAVQCCEGNGSIVSDQDVKERIDVVGVVFRMEKDKGCFGVFVPTRIYFQDRESAQEIILPESCFSADTDVQLLRQKGLI